MTVSEEMIQVIKPCYFGENVLHIYGNLWSITQEQLRQAGHYTPVASNKM